MLYVCLCYRTSKLHLYILAVRLPSVIFQLTNHLLFVNNMRKIAKTVAGNNITFDKQINVGRSINYVLN